MAAKFHERFEIDIGAGEARRRFTARVANLVFERYLGNHYDTWGRYKAAEYVASVLGDRHASNYLAALGGSADFHRHLQAVEALHDYIVRDEAEYSSHTKRDALNEVVKHILAMSEIDIGVRWEGGRFIPQGARLLDDRLVNDPLQWLRARGHAQHLLQSQQNAALLSDVVTDMYEALEALAKVVTGREADLSANRELFISRVKASDGYKRLLRDYIDYANDYRHAAEQGTVRPTPLAAEVENFVYLTGIFIRLALS